MAGPCGDVLKMYDTADFKHIELQRWKLDNFYIDCMLKWQSFGYIGLNKIYY